jgi:glycosyltransferase involved in cell wall biosynthesis
MARIILTTDAWYPQVNGVVRTIDMTSRKLREFGHEVMVLEPTGMPQMPLPFYPEIQICFPMPGKVYGRIRQFKPDHVHVTTEGPLGYMVRHFCIVNGWQFSTSYHTKFPEYMKRLARVPESITYWFLKRFHNAANPVMTATPSLEAELKKQGFKAPIRRWSRGVDLKLFRPQEKVATDLAKPILMYVGRVSAEKNIEAFLALKTPGTKIVVGDGPYRKTLEQRFPDAKFLGYQAGEDLARCYAMAELFVFPSKTDTFGLVVIEALACGVPVAAYPATGPVDIITHESLGACDDDLGKAVERALATGNRDACIAESKKYTWDNCTRQFESNLVKIR